MGLRAIVVVIVRWLLADLNMTLVNERSLSCGVSARRVANFEMLVPGPQTDCTVSSQEKRLDLFYKTNNNTIDHGSRT